MRFGKYSIHGEKSYKYKDREMHKQRRQLRLISHQLKTIMPSAYVLITIGSVLFKLGSIS